jgi:hypothetical protein
MYQNAITTRSTHNASYSNYPSSSGTSKITPNMQKTPLGANNITSSTSSSKLDYGFLKDLKITKDNTSLFEIMKLPQIQEKFIKILQGTTSQTTQEVNVGAIKGKGKVGQTIDTTTTKKQSVVNASLTGQRSKSNTPPFY